MQKTKTLRAAVLHVAVLWGLISPVVGTAANTTPPGLGVLLGGDPAKAIPLLSKPDPIGRISSREMASRYISLAAALMLVGRYSETEPLVQHVLKDENLLFDEKLKFDQPWTIFEVENLGFLFEMKGRFKEAELLYKRALELSQRQPRTRCQMKYQLAEFYNLRHQYDLASKLRSEADYEAKNSDVWSGAGKSQAYKEGANFFQRCFRRGLAAEKAGEGATAFVLYAAAVHDATIHRPGDANSAHLLSVIADSYSRDNYYDAAIQTYGLAVSILKSLPSPPVRTVEEATIGLGTTLDFSGDSAKAAQVYFTVPGGPKRAAKLVREIADSYNNIVRARGCGTTEEIAKTQLLFDRSAGLALGRKTKLKVKMDPFSS